jgi:hypothetical protein
LRLNTLLTIDGPADIDSQGPAELINRALIVRPAARTSVRTNAAARRDAQTVQIAGQSEPAARIPWGNLRIPSFPLIAIRILQLASNEDVSMRQLGDRISSSPSFSSEVLAIANSALYAPRYPVTSILQAIAVLGLNRLKASVSPLESGPTLASL